MKICNTALRDPSKTILLFLHSHVKPTLRATIKFVEATDTNCVYSCTDHQCQQVFAVFRWKMGNISYAKKSFAKISQSTVFMNCQWTMFFSLKKAGHWTGCILAVTRLHQLYWSDQVMGTATTYTQYSEVVPSNVYHADVIHWYCVWFLTQMICADSAYHRSGSFHGKNNLRFKFSHSPDSSAM